MSAALNRRLAQARARLQAGDAAGARLLCAEVVRRAPRNPDALCLLGVAELVTGDARAALPPLMQAVAVEPRHGAALENLGLAHLMLGDFADAERTLRVAAALSGAPPSVFMRLGVAMLNQGRPAEAVAELERALEFEPHNADIHLNLGQALAAAGDSADARNRFEAALRIAPDHADAMYNLGVLCLAEENLDLARGWFERALGHAPQHLDALVNLGVVLQKEQRLDAALACFHRALAIDPEAIPARQALAFACIAFGRMNEGVTHLRRILRVQPGHRGALGALADTLFKMGEAKEAESVARRANELDPAAVEPYGVLAEIHALRGELEESVAVLAAGYQRTASNSLLGALTFGLRRLCDWDKWDAAWRKMALVLEDSVELAGPFSLLCEPVSAAQQLACARKVTQTRFGSGTAVPRNPSAQRGERGRLRIGYLSSDFREHAISDLVAEVLELHDRRRFEVFAYSHGPDDRSAMRARLKHACEHFIDIAPLADDAAARRIRDDELDILVDLNGYTRGARTAILALRPCAKQASWIGYPGTMGADFIDYLIADPMVIPAGQECAYAERIVRLSHCYLPHDRTRAVDAPLSRAAYGLPEEAFVFCCFTQPYKLTPDIFKCWMNLLLQLADSVLWLADDHPATSAGLRRAAQTHGVAPTRLVFAPRLPAIAQHLARYRVADLALDTFPYTSHTTAIDALWADCLLVALCGETFAARVSGSILTACNLPELVTYSLADYERLALRMATDKPFRDALRTKLQANRLATPLFDSLTFTRDLESLYRDIAGAPPLTHGTADERR